MNRDVIEGEKEHVMEHAIVGLIIAAVIGFIFYTRSKKKNAGTGTGGSGSGGKKPPTQAEK